MPEPPRRPAATRTHSVARPAEAGIRTILGKAAREPVSSTAALIEASRPAGRPRLGLMRRAVEAD